MEITQSHMAAFLHTRNRLLPVGVTTWGLFRCRNGEVHTEVLGQSDAMCTTGLLRQHQGDIGWKTVMRDLRCKELSEMLQCSFKEQRPIDAVFLGATVFWRVIVAAPNQCSSDKIRDIVTGFERGGDDGLRLGRVNTILRGIGRVERSQYVVVEDPALVVALDFFRRNSCDLDWVKQQVYGSRLLHVPETFPVNVPTLEEVLLLQIQS